MKVFPADRTIKFKSKPSCVATLGIFDGLHKGHIYVLRKVISHARRMKFKSLLISFSPHPLDFYNKKFPGYITSQNQMIDILSKHPLDYFWIIRFNKMIARMSGRNFLCYVLKYFNIKRIIVADDFRFGHKARHTVRDLEKICHEKGIELERIRKLKIDNRIINSSLARRLIKRADFKTVKLLLGRAYSIKGRVVKGKTIGSRVLGIPTVNLDIHKRVLPASGVYISKIKYKDKIYRGITSLGGAPTFGEKKTTLETHIFNFNKNIYKDFVEIIFIRKLRKEKKFDNLYHLRQQICKDMDLAKEFFSNHNILGLP